MRQEEFPFSSKRRCRHEPVNLSTVVRKLPHKLTIVVHGEDLCVNRSREIYSGVLAVNEQESMELERITFAERVGVTANDVASLVDPSRSSTRGACTGIVEDFEIAG